jgi:hypothetical protein
MSEYQGNGNQFKTYDPTIKEFLEEINKYKDDISIDGETVNSHKLRTRVNVSCINNEKFYTLTGVAVDYLGGCGCPSGITLEIMEE